MRKSFEMLKAAIIFLLNSLMVAMGHLVHSDTSSSQSLQFPFAGPSRQHLPPKLVTSLRPTDMGVGDGLLPVQCYKAGRRAGDTPLQSKTTTQQPEESRMNHDDNVSFLESVASEPSEYKLSQTSTSMLENRQVLTDLQCEQLVQKIKVEQQASRQVSVDNLEILYCDAHICVVNKPSGVLSVPGPRRNPSLANLVYNQMKPDIDLDQMVVHRLDMATSGILVYALSLGALSKLHLDFKERRVQKTYQALVAHESSLVLSELSSLEGEIDVDMERDPDNPPFMRLAQPKNLYHECVDSEEVGFGKIGPSHKFYTQTPKESLTSWTLVSREVFHGIPVSRLNLRPLTGRTHQLRVHCARALLAPIVGDDIYSTNEKNLSLCLHARQLCIYHPISGAPMCFEADPPF